MSADTMQRITGIHDIALGVWVRTNDGDLGQPRNENFII